MFSFLYLTTTTTEKKINKRRVSQSNLETYINKFKSAENKSDENNHAT